MNCSEIQDLAAALVDHERLTPRELDEVELHLKTCPTCQFEYEMDLMTSHIVHARIPLVDTPEASYQSIVAATRS
ncbi:MAG: zf-HC2 domain-containing protein [Bacteroidota bacterium]|nr:zf-HC2 domain-containing protein [Bacteroidota bacterium]MDP4234434.1 zf-HC2 domain-containing protein [Bacteroidota bacterium]MDP4244000.1 zf-HC2 domain-containing protein [Bacteroidota bacterium]MDP4288166.1 zf-HC2 domain-containing protein [Bacteroidota bacterium]